MELEASEFIRRFLLHILPEKYVKVRYYGFMSNSQRKKQLKKCKELLKYKTRSNETINEEEKDAKNKIRCVCLACKYPKISLVTEKVDIKGRESPIERYERQKY